MMFAEDTELADDTGIVVRYLPPRMTQEAYEATLERLRDLGPGGMDECVGHVVIGEEDHLRFSEIWRSRDAYERSLPTVRSPPRRRGSTCTTSRPPPATPSRSPSSRACTLRTEPAAETSPWTFGA